MEDQIIEIHAKWVLAVFTVEKVRVEDPREQPHDRGAEWVFRREREREAEHAALVG